MVFYKINFINVSNFYEGPVFHSMLYYKMITSNLVAFNISSTITIQTSMRKVWGTLTKPILNVQEYNRPFGIRKEYQGNENLILQASKDVAKPNKKQSHSKWQFDLKKHQIHEDNFR